MKTSGKRQQNGHQMGKLQECSGQGVFFGGLDTFNFSASYHDAYQKAKARHLHELEESEGITVNIDYKQSGLGTASPAPPEDKYLLYTNPNSFSFTLSPFSDSVLDEQEMFRLETCEEIVISATFTVFLNIM